MLQQHEAVSEGPNAHGRLIGVIGSRGSYNDGLLRSLHHNLRFSPSVCYASSSEPPFDPLLPEFTVYQTLHHAALMRCTFESDVQRDLVINSILQLLEMDEIRDIVVGENCVETDIRHRPSVDKRCLDRCPIQTSFSQAATMPLPSPSPVHHLLPSGQSPCHHSSPRTPSSRCSGKFIFPISPPSSPVLHLTSFSSPSKRRSPTKLLASFGEAASDLFTNSDYKHTGRRTAKEGDSDDDKDNKTDEELSRLEAGIMKECDDKDYQCQQPSQLNIEQRRILRIGLELLTAPRVLLLDGLFSGLDCRGSEYVMRVLSAVAQSGVRVIISLQDGVVPSLDAAKYVDDLAVLDSRGQAVYLGPSEHAASYFQALGFVHPAPVDTLLFIQHILRGAGDFRASSQRPDSPADLHAEWRAYVAHKENLASTASFLKPGHEELKEPSPALFSTTPTSTSPRTSTPSEKLQSDVHQWLESGKDRLPMLDTSKAPIMMVSATFPTTSNFSALGILPKEDGSPLSSPSSLSSLSSVPSPCSSISPAAMSSSSSSSWSACGSPPRRITFASNLVETKEFDFRTPPKACSKDGYDGGEDEDSEDNDASSASLLHAEEHDDGPDIDSEEEDTDSEEEGTDDEDEESDEGVFYDHDASSHRHLISICSSSASYADERPLTHQSLWMRLKSAIGLTSDCRDDADSTRCSVDADETSLLTGHLSATRHEPALSSLMEGDLPDWFLVGLIGGPLSLMILQEQERKAITRSCNQSRPANTQFGPGVSQPRQRSDRLKCRAPKMKSLWTNRRRFALAGVLSQMGVMG